MSADGHLYLAEAGRGGATHCFTDPVMGTTCAGLTGSIDLVTSHGVSRLVSGLVSVAGQGGVAAEGMVAVSASRGQLYGQFAGNTVGVAQAPLPAFLVKAALRDFGQFGWVGRQRLPRRSPGSATTTSHGPTSTSTSCPTSSPTPTPTVSWSPAAGGSSSTRGRTRSTRSPPTASVHVLTFLGTPDGASSTRCRPALPKGPDGALYVAELPAASSRPATRACWRIDVSSGGAKKSVWARGLTTVQGCGFDRWGNFYATEFEVSGLDEGPTADPRGAVVKISTGSASARRSGLGQLFFPSGFAAGQGRLGLRLQLQHRSGRPASGRARTVARWCASAEAISSSGTHRRRPAWERRRWVAWYEGSVPDADASTRAACCRSPASAFVVLAAEPLYVLVDTAVVGHLGTRAAGRPRHRRPRCSRWSSSSGRSSSTAPRRGRPAGTAPGDRAAAVNEGVQASWLAVGSASPSWSSASCSPHR